MNTKDFEAKYANIAAYLKEDGVRQTINVEEIEEGDTITIVGVPDTISTGKINDVERKWLTVNCTGDRDSVSLATLVGTAKVGKHFGEEKAKLPDLVRLPHNKMEAVIAVEENLVGKTIRCVAKVEVENPRFDNSMTYYLWQIVK